MESIGYLQKIKELEKFKEEKRQCNIRLNELELKVIGDMFAYMFY